MEIIELMVRRTIDNRGGTFSPRTGKMPRIGFMVAHSTQNDRVVPTDQNASEEEQLAKVTYEIRRYQSEKA